MHPSMYALLRGRHAALSAPEGSGGPVPDPVVPPVVVPPVVPKVSDAEAALLKEVMTKKAEAKALETKLAEVTQRLTAFEGIDPVAVKELLATQAAAVAAAAKAEEDAALKRGEFDRIKATMVDGHKTEIQKLQDLIKAGQSELSKTVGLVNDLTVGSAFDGSAFIRDDLVLPTAKVRAIYGPNFDIVDGKIVAYDKPKTDAGRTALVDASGNGLGFEDAIKKLIAADPDHDRLLKSKIAPGANSGTSGVKVPDTGKEEPSGRARIAAGLALRKTAK